MQMEGTSISFSYLFNEWISKTVSAMVEPSQLFLDKWGPDFVIIIRINFASKRTSTDFRGPITYKRDKQVEWVCHLPMSAVIMSKNPKKTAIDIVLKSAISCLDKLAIDTTKLVINRSRMESVVLASKEMLSV